MDQAFSGVFDGAQGCGKAQLGEKTFLDELYPAIEVLKVHWDDMKTASSSATAAVREAFLATRGMLAKHGRKAIWGGQSRAYPNPSAAVAALLMEGFSQNMMH